MSNRFLLSLLVCFTVASFAGCKSLDLGGEQKIESKDKDPWWKKENLPPVKPASKIVAIWTNSVLNETGEVPIRGLGGRVYFYDATHQPVRVDGKLTVFLYDDTRKAEEETQEATRKIHFSAEEIAESYTPTEFGPSYSFWLPWDAVGGERTQLSVIPVYTSKEGEMLVGEQARYLLPGTKPTALVEAPRKKGGVVAASFTDDNFKRSNGRLFDEDAASQLRLRSSTIKVPRSVQQRLLQRNSNPAAAGSKTTNRNRKKNSMMSSQRNSNATLGQQGLAQTQTQVASVGASALENATEKQSTDSELGRRRAQTWQSAQQAFARDSISPGREGSLFAR